MLSVVSFMKFLLVNLIMMQPVFNLYDFDSVYVKSN